MDKASQDFSSFLEGIPDAVIAVDSEGVIRLVNQQAEVMFGYVRGELIGNPIEMLVPERVRGKHPHHRALYSLDPKKRPMGLGLELSAQRKTGAEFPVDISLSQVHVDNEMLVLAAVRDQTERKKYEALFSSELSANVTALTKSVKELTELFAADKESRKKQRRRDRWVFTTLGVVLVTGVGGNFYALRRVSDSNSLSKQTERSTCEAINQANKAIHDLFEPFATFSPSLIPAGASPKEIASIKAQDVRRKAQSDAFFADLNRRTAAKTCP